MLHGLCAYIVSDNKSAVIFTIISLSINVCLWLLSDFLFIIIFKQYDYAMPWSIFFSYFLCLEFNELLWFVHYCFYQIVKTFGHYFFKYVFLSYFLLLSQIIACVLGHLKLAQRCPASFILFYLDSIYCYVFMFTNLFFCNVSSFNLTHYIFHFLYCIFHLQKFSLDLFISSMPLLIF